MALKNIPQAERLLSGTLTSYLSDVATTCVMSDPPSKFPTYIDIEPDSTTKKELVRAVAVSGSTVTIERSVNGVTTDHAANATYKQKLTSRHWDAVSDALEKGYLMEDALRVLIRVSDTQFTITGYGASDDLTGVYTTGRVLRINSSASYVMTVTSSSYNAGTNKTTVNVSATLPTPVSTVEFGVAPEGGTDLPLVSKTLTSPVLTTPKVVTSINDANGNEVIKTPATTSAVNEVTVTNSATGNAVQVSATGDDTNISLNLVSKGSGTVQANGTAVSTAVKASGAEITTGTDDAKFATSKALADAGVNTRLKSKIINFTRDGTAAGGDVSYTGVGFTPTSIDVHMVVDGTVRWCIGHVDSAKTSSAIYEYANNLMSYTDSLCSYTDKNNWAQYAVVKTYDADGFTLTWAKTGTPTAGTMSIRAICYR